MGFTRRFLWYFLFADEKKVRTFPLRADGIRPYDITRGAVVSCVNPSVTAYAVPPPFTQGRLWILHPKEAYQIKFT